MESPRTSHPTLATGSRLLAVAAAALLIVPGLAAREAKRFALESAAGLRLNNVVAEPAVLQGKKGLRVAMTDERLKQFRAMTSEQQADAQVRVGQYAVIEGAEFGNGVIEAEIAGAPTPGSGEGARGFVGIAFRLQQNGA